MFLIEYNIRKTLFIVFFALSFGSVLTIGLVSNFYVLSALRLVNGIGVSYICIFNPIWVDQFAPKSSASILMAIHNLSSILGTILGFAMTSLLPKTSWNLSYLIQGFILGGLFIFYFMLKEKYFDRRMLRYKETNTFYIQCNILDRSNDISMVSENSDSKRSSSVLVLNPNNKQIENTVNINGASDVSRSSTIETIEKLEFPERTFTLAEKFPLLLSNKIYVLLTFTITIFLFITTVLLQWMKKYLTDVIKISNETADVSFVATCLTSPILGILSGGFVVQKLGGYHTIKAMYLCLFNSLACGVLALCVLPIQNLIGFAIVVWLYLFLGAMMNPCINGSILKSLPNELKGTGNTLQFIISNLIGVSPAPSIYGLINDGTKLYLPSLAMTICLSISFIASFLIFLIVRIIRREGYTLEIDPVEEEIPS